MSGVLTCHGCGCLLAVQHDAGALAKQLADLHNNRGGCFCIGCCDAKGHKGHDGNADAKAKPSK